MGCLIAHLESLGIRISLPAIYEGDLHSFRLASCSPSSQPLLFRVSVIQELAIWQEQRDEAKQRKASGASRSSGIGSASGGGAMGEGKLASGSKDGATGQEENDEKPAAEVGTPPMIGRLIRSS